MARDEFVLAGKFAQREIRLKIGWFVGSLVGWLFE
jgi:hypothetical protein